jgi:hypothetical protein
MNDTQLTEPPFDARELTKLESAISGVFAAIALTIIIILLPSQSLPDHAYDAPLREAAIATFITVFFTSLLAAMLLAFTGSEIRNSKRCFTLLLVIGFILGTAIVLTMFGIVLLVYAFKVTSIKGIAKFILGTTMTLALAQAMFEASRVAAVMYDITPLSVWRNRAYLFSLMISGLSLPVLTLLMYSLNQSIIPIPSRNFDYLLYTCVILSTVFGGVAIARSNIPANAKLSFNWLLVVVQCFSFVIACLILCVPV